jgi:hypothetical protein
VVRAFKSLLVRHDTWPQLCKGFLIVGRPDAKLQQLRKPHLLKIYPPIGQTPDDEHAFLFPGMKSGSPMCSPSWTCTSANDLGVVSLL